MLQVVEYTFEVETDEAEASDPIAEAAADVGAMVSLLTDTYGVGVGITVPVSVEGAVVMLTVAVATAA